MFVAKQPMDFPPQHAFLSDQSGGLVQRPSHGIILTRKTADEQLGASLSPADISECQRQFFDSIFLPLNLV